MDNETLYQEIQTKTLEGRIACAQCFEIARRCDVSLRQIGDVCDDQDIRITSCQLGCFK